MEIVKVELKDMQYEFQLLLGSNEVINLIEKFDNSQKFDDSKLGNIVNYYKDSLYLHTRNLMNIFTRTKFIYECKETGEIPKIKSELYSDWKPVIEKFGLHLNTSRNQKSVSNYRAGKHINEMHSSFTKEVIESWEKWISLTSDHERKKKVQLVFAECQKAAISDRDKLDRFLV